MPKRKRPKGLDPKRSFGILLRELRQQRGFSQEDFAHKMGYHRNYIGQLERGEKSPSLSALFIFANGLGLRPSDLLSRMERMIANSTL